MANTNAPFGLKYDGITGGSAAPTVSLVQREIAYNNATKIFHGDPVLNLSTGYIGQWVNGSNVALLAGVFNGCRYLSLSQGKVIYSPFWPGADAAQNTVFADILPLQPGLSLQFYVQTGAAGMTRADIGNTCDIVVGTGNTTTGQSGAYLDVAGTTATFPLRVLNMYPGIGAGSDATSAYNWVVVGANLAAQAGV
jgi:hypothetical protein